MIQPSMDKLRLKYLLNLKQNNEPAFSSHAISTDTDQAIFAFNLFSTPAAAN